MTQVKDRSPHGPHLAYLRKCNGGGKSDKGQGFGCDKEGPCVLLWPWLSPWLSIGRGHPGARSGPQPGKPPRLCFTHRYESDPVLSDIQCAGVYLHVVALGHWRRGRKAETERRRVRWSSGHIFFCQQFPNCFWILVSTPV